MEQFSLDNGLRVLVENVPTSRICAVAFCVRDGSAYDPPSLGGISAAMCEMFFKGTESRDVESLTNALDALGMHRFATAGNEQLVIGATFLPQHLEAALGLLGEALMRPAFPADQLEVVKSIQMQKIRRREDQPDSRLRRLLSATHLAGPLGRPGLGDWETVAAIGRPQVFERYRAGFSPQTVTVAFSGGVQAETCRQVTEKVFREWRGEATPRQALPPPPAHPAKAHETIEAEQVHLGLAFRSVPVTDEDYYPVAVGLAVLSGGMSARLFTEVREKRGLCYGISAWHGHHRLEGSVYAAASTTTERAPRTLEVTLGEIRRLQAEPISDDELQTAKIGLKSALLMSLQVAESRLQQLLADDFYRGRVLPPEEKIARLEAVTAEDIHAALARHGPDPLTVVSVGKKELG